MVPDQPQIELGVSQPPQCGVHLQVGLKFTFGQHMSILVHGKHGFHPNLSEKWDAQALLDIPSLSWITSCTNWLLKKAPRVLDSYGVTNYRFIIIRFIRLSSSTIDLDIRTLLLNNNNKTILVTNNYWTRLMNSNWQPGLHPTQSVKPLSNTDSAAAQGFKDGSTKTAGCQGGQLVNLSFSSRPNDAGWFIVSFSECVWSNLLSKHSPSANTLAIFLLLHGVILIWLRQLHGCSATVDEGLRTVAIRGHNHGWWLPLSISWFIRWLMIGDMIKTNNNNAHLLGDRPLLVNDEPVKKCWSSNEHAQLSFDGCTHGITWVWINNKYNSTQHWQAITTQRWCFCWFVRCSH